MLSRNIFFKEAREWQGLSQQQIIEMIDNEVNQSSLSAYEKGRQKISKDKLGIIASVLKINPDYISDTQSNPFKSDNLIKFFVKERTVTGDPIEPFCFLITNNIKLHFLSLICEPDIITRIKNINLHINPVYAVAIKDQDNNYYIVRGKSKSDIITIEYSLFDKFKFFINIEAQQNMKKQFLFAERQVNKEIYEKLKSWTIEKSDIISLIDESESLFRSYLIPTNDELTLLSILREYNTMPIEIIEYITSSKKSQNERG